MPVLSQEYIEILGPLIVPFERSPNKSLEDNLEIGEGHNDEFLAKIHDGRDNDYPTPFLELTVEELHKHRITKGGAFPDKCYLWIIDSVSIKLIWEKTPNYRRGEGNPDKPFVCHTNITGCEPAFIGGEMYFCQDGNTYVNFKSDRYGWPETKEKKVTAVMYIREVGYKNVILIDPFGP